MLALLVGHCEGILDGLLHSGLDVIGWHMSLARVKFTMLLTMSFPMQSSHAIHGRRTAHSSRLVRNLILQEHSPTPRGGYTRVYDQSSKGKSS